VSGLTCPLPQVPEFLAGLDRAGLALTPGAREALGRVADADGSGAVAPPRPLALRGHAASLAPY